MEPLVIGYIGVAILFVILFSGMPIGVVMGAVGFVGMVVLGGWAAGFGILGHVPYRTWSSYELSVAPLFILMGTLCFYAGVSQDLYKTAYNWLGSLPGGLAVATVGACAAFSAVCGSSVATAATIGTVALPEMKRYKYDPALATGCIAAGGTMGILIPPSVAMIIYGLLTEQSVGKLFLAGFIPGFIQAFFYMIVIYVICKRNPIMGPRGPQTSLREKFVSLKDSSAVLILFLVIMGGIYLGVFTPTEAGGIGAFGAFLFVVLRKKFTSKTLKDSLSSTIVTTAMLFIIVTGAMIFGYFLTVTKIPSELARFISLLAVNRYVILAAILVIYIFLGCIIESMSMMLLTVPIFFPVMQVLGFDPIWFGIIVVRMVEIAQITPPVGVNVYVITAMAGDIPMGTVFRGIFPFFIADLVEVVLLVVVPELATWLPSLMK
jgi:C4-dicarboxylate transporter DctM subunit